MGKERVEDELAGVHDRPGVHTVQNNINNNEATPTRFSSSPDSNFMPSSIRTTLILMALLASSAWESKGMCE